MSGVFLGVLPMGRIPKNSKVVNFTRRQPDTILGQVPV